MVDFDDINYLKYDIDKYVFFDIFHKNDQIILICPVYYNNYDYSKINIFANNNILYLSEKKLKIEREPIVILIYNYISEEKKNNITVKYENITKTFELINFKSKKKKNLAQTTLFKDDFYLIELFYNYYTKQGVETFFLYCNKEITNEIISVCANKNIKLLEWDFNYWNIDCDYKHHAQLGQMHHAMYKYGKNEYNYMIFNDLDEYMYITNKKIIDYIFEKQKECYVFLNYWSETIDGNIPKKIPDIIRIGIKYEYKDRSKCIYKLDNVDYINIHYNKNFTNYQLDINNNMLLHFFNFTDRDFTKDINIFTTNKLFILQN